MAADRRPIVLRKKKVAGHAHHGGAWKVAYADFVTAMMALFMVMWLLASSDEKTRKEIANYFRTGIMADGDMSMDHAAQIQPSLIEETGLPLPTRRAMIREHTLALRDAIQAMVASDPEIAKIADQVQVTETPEGTLIEAIDKDGKDSMLFEVSSANLKPALVDFLTRLAPALERLEATVEIMGHTDARPFQGGGGDNWSLSFARGDAARKILERSGLPPQKVSGVVGHADAQLHDVNHPYAAQNRRLAILVRPKEPT